MIVPCHRPGPHLVAALESIARQEFAPGFEVLLVDNSPALELRSWTGRFPANLNLRLIEANEKASVSFARNKGVSASRGEVVCFVDADDEIAPGYLAALAEALETHDFVTSKVEAATLNPEWSRLVHGPDALEDDVWQFYGFLPATGSHVALRRSLFDALGGFDEDNSGSEDIDFCWRAQLDHGVRIHMVKSAVYRYRYRDTIWGLFQQTRHWGAAIVYLYTRFGERGMPGRSWRETVGEWWGVAVQMLKARTKAEWGAAVVGAGYCVGRCIGSIRYRTLYL